MDTAAAMKHGLFVQNFHMLHVQPAAASVSQTTAPRKAMDPPAPTTADHDNKQGKKWKISNLFRRRKKEVQQTYSDSSSDTDEDKPSYLRHKYGSGNSLTSSDTHGGGSLTRKDRREILKARLEASRRKNSTSSDENSKLSRYKSDESLTHRKTRSARTERYLKRLSKDDESSSTNRPVSHTPSPIVSPKMHHRNLSEPKNNSYIHLAPPNTNGLPSPFLHRTPPPPPPRDPNRKCTNFIRSRSDHMINEDFQYLADKTPRSRKPIHVIPMHEPSPENILPPIPIWLNEPIKQEYRHSISPMNQDFRHHTYINEPINQDFRRVSSLNEPINQDFRRNSSIHEPINRPVSQDRRSWIGQTTYYNETTTKPMKRATSVETTYFEPSKPVKRATSVDVQLRSSKTPPPPPVRRFSRQNSNEDETNNKPVRFSRQSSVEEEPKVEPKRNNLEDALNELEEIYKSLKLSDEDLLDRAERRDLPTVHQNLPASAGDDDDIILRNNNHQRAPPNRRSGIPDLKTDDMAYRRFNPSAIPPAAPTRQSGSYLLVSPTLSPPLPVSTLTVGEEPDVTYDDMSYRQIRTANSTTKVLDVQPPFGIPVKPSPAAPDSDYLHVTPLDKFRPSLRPRKTPDVVKDDLAFRNLRKDGTTDKRKRAVRSLSANLISLMEGQNIEKTQSMSQIHRPPPSWIERAHLIDTSTETLTQSRANLKSLRNSFFNSRPNSYFDENSRPNSYYFPDNSRPNSMYTQAEYSRPNEAMYPIDEGKLDELLSQLAREAHDTSEKLGIELEKLRDGSHSVEDLSNPKQGSIRTLTHTSNDTWYPTQSSAFKPPEYVRHSYVLLSNYDSPQVFGMSTQIKTSERFRVASSRPGLIPQEDAARRSERIALYKETRRKQLAAQYSSNNAPPTSSSSGVESPGPGETAAPKRFISREDKGCVSEPLRNIRTTRASRLRAAALIGSPVTDVKSAPEAKVTTRKSSKVNASDLSSSSAPSSGVPSRESTPQIVSSTPKTERREKDKSSKRKSNLNRSLTEEPIPVALSSDSATDDSSVTRRRKPIRTSSSMGAGCNVSNNPMRSTPPPPPQNIPPVFQRLICNVRPVRQKPSADVSKHVDQVMANAKEIEKRMERLTKNKTTLQTTVRKPPERKVSEPRKTPERKVSEPIRKTPERKVSEPVRKTPERKISEPIRKTPERRISEPVRKTTIRKSPEKNSNLTENLDNLIAVLAGSDNDSPTLIDNNFNNNEGTLTDNGAILNGSQDDEDSEIIIDIKTTPIINGAAAATDNRSTKINENNGIMQNNGVQRSSPIKKPLKNNNRGAESSDGADVEADNKPRTILKKKSVDESSTPVSILKHKDEVVVAAAATTLVTDAMMAEGVTSQRPPSILKKRASLEEQSADEEAGILRRSSREELLQDRPFSPEPQSILKLRNASGPSARPILKKKSSDDLSDEPRPILKKKASTEDEMETPRPILKSSGRRSEEEGSNYSSAAGSPARRSPCIIEDAVIRNQVNLHLRFNIDQADTQPGCDATSPGEERRPSVSERAQLFMKLSELNQQTVVTQRDPAQRRERAKRFSTQPVTSEEVDEARGQIQAKSSTEQQSAGSLSSLQQSPNNAGEPEEEDPSKMSLAERVRLFETKAQAKPPAPSSLLAACPRRRAARRNVTSTRFHTQPVTEAEVQQIAAPEASQNNATPPVRKTERISPLAASFTKPPDPGILGGLSARAAREAMIEHAAKILSKPVTSSQEDVIQMDQDRPRGILKHASSVPPVSKQPSSSPEIEETDIVRGILKIPASAIQQARLLAANALNSSVKSAMKKESSFEDVSPRVGILKPESTEWSEASSSEDDVIATEVKDDLASILNDVSNANSDNCDVASLLNNTKFNDLVPNNPVDITANFEAILADNLKEDFSDLDLNDSLKEAGILNEYSVKKSSDLEELFSSVVQSSDEGDTSSSGGREVKNILVCEKRYTEMVAGEDVTGCLPDQPIKYNGLRETVSQTTSPVKEVKLNVKKQNPSVLDRLSLSPGPQRSKTQPIVVSEKGNNLSIKERLAALKQSGETEWKKRVNRTSPERFTNGNAPNCGMKPLQTSASMPGATGGILAEKLNQLDKSAQDWKKRIGPNDAIEFSVAGRMGIATPLASPVHLPAADRKKKTPKPARFRSKVAPKNHSTPSSPQKDLAVTLTRSISAPDGGQGDAQTVEVPSPNDETFSAFFSTTLTETQQITEAVEICDFEELTQHTLLVQNKRSVKMQRRRLGSRNPVKALAARTDLLHEYQEVRTGAADREMKRLNVEKLAKNSNLAVEALAGLASKEDFKAIALKKTGSKSPVALVPYSDLMLIQVKGRRHVQTRLVQPVPESINHGDSYILVTPNAIYNWLGKLSNVIERTRSAEVALQISQRKDLGCTKAAGAVLTVDEGKGPGTGGLHRRAFWKLLGVEDGEGTAQEAGHPDEDESFEASVTDTNMIYTVEGNELVPLEKFWGCIPRIEMLDHSKVLVFDFGSELYVWSGKNADPETRKTGVTLARELWEADVDYSECEVSPLGDEITGQRPPWSLLGKLSQHMETALFREKFLDWPEFSRVIRVKEREGDDKQVDGSIEVSPIDVKELLAIEWTEPDLELEGSHLGRGDSYFDVETHRQFEITTSAVTIWHVEEFECDLLPKESLGHFHSDDSYVVRWSYSVTVTGRELGGAPSKHAMVGRARCAYFFWQGSGASLNEQGAAALLTVELDSEQGPHVRVEQGAEPAAFLRLFGGHMTTHSGHRADSGNNKGRLYLVRCGAHKEEGSLTQVPCSVRQLRSRASLLLLDAAAGVLYVWHGNQAHATTRHAALNLANNVRDTRPAEFGLSQDSQLEVIEVKEGHEPEKFFKGLGGSKKQLYVSLPPSKSLPALRLFHMSSVSGTFAATEVLSPGRSQDPPQAFPFQQCELYNASQPALFLLDAGSELWLWQGWWGDEGGEESAGSGAVRWQAERRAAMQTALDLWQSTPRTKKDVSAYLVWAGLEPLEFTNLFPNWTDRDDAAECNIQDGRKPGEVLNVEDELARLTRSTYPPAQLLQRPLPDGVDPTRLEEYLAPSHFEELLGMSKEEFMELPSWKQTNIKKDIGLF